MTVEIEYRIADNALTGDDEIICGCIDLTVGQIKTELAANSTEGFDGLLARTGAGKTCTACLLDLEYLYTSLPRHGEVPLTKRGMRGQPTSKPSLKRRIYGILDGLGPLVPYPLEGVAPILIGADIEQRLTVASHSLMYEGGIASPPITYSVGVYDAEGKFRGHLKHRVEMGESWRMNLSEMFPKEVRAENFLSVGLMKIKWRFSAPGKRGTARPQIEINARSGSCAVHTQRAGGALEKWVILNWKPADQRLFLTIVNPARRRLEGNILYPILNGDGDGIAPQSHRISVAANGASVHEIVMSGETSRRLAGRPMGIRAVLNNPSYKMHVLCAAPDLGRFSIDHL